MAMNKRTSLLGLAAFAATMAGALAPASQAMAQAYPSKPITIVVSYPPGGDTDVIARAYAEKLAAKLGQPVVIENRPGASGTIGNGHVARSAPDGYTLLFTPSTFPIARHVLRQGTGVINDPNTDFTPIIMTGTIPLLLVASNQSGIKDVRQLIAEAKSGKPLSYGSPGSGSPMHVLAEVMNREAGIKISHVPYRGVAPAIADVLGGHIATAWVTPGAVAQHLAANRLVPLALAERARTSQMPNTPTFNELGIKDMELSAWFGLLGPKGLPTNIVNTLNAALNEIIRMPDVQARQQTLSITPVGGDPARLARQVAEEDARFAKLVKEFGILAD
jgi:tripartite-type tricarboxylate transporter receptor subunit TctC